MPATRREDEGEELGDLVVGDEVAGGRCVSTAAREEAVF